MTDLMSVDRLLKSTFGVMLQWSCNALEMRGDCEAYEVRINKEW